MSHAEQSLLPGFDAPAEPSDRLFFAILPPPEVAAEITRLGQKMQSELGLRGKLLAADRLHITLHHLGDFAGLPRDVLAQAQMAAISVAAKSFDVTFDRAESFTSKPRNLPFVLRGNEGLAKVTGFQQDLGAALSKARFKLIDKSGYTPHLTLLYDDRAMTGQAIEPITWTAHEFVLIHSLLGKTMHIPLGRWPLNG